MKNRVTVSILIKKSFEEMHLAPYRIDNLELHIVLNRGAHDTYGNREHPPMFLPKRHQKTRERYAGRYYIMRNRRRLSLGGLS